MMFNLKPLIFMVTVLIISGGFVSGRYSSILDRDFTLRVVVECFDGTGRTTLGKVSATESYSSKDQRGVVKLLADKPTEVGSRLEYYHDSKQDAWLEVFPKENLCISSSRYDLHQNLYKSPIFHKIDQILSSACQECANDTSTKHLIGAARFLLLVQKLRPKFERPIRISTRAGLHRSVYHIAGLEVDESSSLELFVHYNGILEATSRASDRVQPEYVRLHHAVEGGETNIIGIRFFQFKLLQDTTSVQDGQTQHSLAFPTGMYCSKALSSALGQTRQPEVELIRAELEQARKFTFASRDLDHPESVATTFYTLDLQTKLIKKEQLIDGVQSTTVYDLKERIRYNLMTKLGRPQEAECAMNKLDNLQPIVGSNEKFINLEQLVYLGKAQINSVDVLIFEEFPSRYSSLPIWLQPPVLATPVDGDNPPFRADELLDSHIYITYFFAFGAQQSLGDEIGPLMRVEITVRDAVSRIVWQRRLAITEFSAGHLDELHSFSLANICQAGLKAGQVNAILEADIPLQQMNPIMLQADERNEILIETLDRDYGIRRTQIDHLSSRLLTHNEAQKVVLELEFTVSQSMEQSVVQVDCVYLGRGQLLGYESLGVKNYTGIATFEDCMWLANRHYLDIDKEEVLFTYTDRVECLVDRLYRYKYLSGHEAVLNAGSNKSISLNYYPYEFGTKKIYTIKRMEANFSSSMSTKGMHFFQTGPFKMLGHSLELKFKAGSDKLGLRFDKIDLSGHLSAIFGENYHPERIAGLSWSERDADNSLNRLIDFAKGPKSLTSSGLGGPEMNEPLCRSHCLLDLSCQSYSFCTRWGAREARCLISSIDVGKSIVMKQLNNIKETLTKISGQKQVASKRKTPRATIMFDEGSLQQPELEVILDGTCSISGKSHGDMFKPTYPASVAGATVDFVDRTVRSKDECAKKCFAKNVNYLKELAHHKLASLESIPPISDGNYHLAAWESIIDWAREGTKDFCTGFLYANEVPATNGSRARGCLIATASEEQSRPGGSPLQANMESISMVQHKLVYSQLFWRLPNVRMLANKELDNRTEMAKQGELLESHLAGANSQIKLPIDDVEFCARACVMQLHGPRPMCSSFDFVHEQVGNTVTRYCLLNSQSLHDLEHRGLDSQQQILHDEEDSVNFWHFEPRDAALQTQSLKPIPATCKVPYTGQSAFISISLISKLIGLVSGLVIGVKLTNHVLLELERIEEPPTGRAVRQILRLSGVSLTSNLGENEVRMS